jgi:type IV secretory pathway TrbL component
MSNWKTALGVLGAIAAVVMIAGFGATSAGTLPYKADAMASWMQAIGSVAAILGAYWIGERQSASTLKRRLGAYAAVAKSARDQAMNVSDLAAALNGQQFNRNWIDQNGPVYRSAFASTESIPLSDLGTAEAVRALIVLKTALARMERFIDVQAEAGQRDETTHAFNQKQLFSMAWVIDISWNDLARSLDNAADA